MARRDPSLAASRVVMSVGKGLYRRLPRGLRQRLEDRFFYAVFNVTRVTNDNYGWRPGDPDSSATGPQGEAPPG